MGKEKISPLFESAQQRVWIETMEKETASFASYSISMDMCREDSSKKVNLRLLVNLVSNEKVC
jgi:hypothetical protein